MTFLDFLRDVGKFARVGTMLNKDSVKSRMEASNAGDDSGAGSDAQSSGLSFTEFSYQLLQGYDFMHLYRTRDCRIQIGGSDQWGNITAGTDLIRRLCRCATHYPAAQCAPSRITLSISLTLFSQRKKIEATISEFWRKEEHFF